MTVKIERCLHCGGTGKILRPLDERDLYESESHRKSRGRLTDCPVCHGCGARKVVIPIEAVS